ncbi:MAG TPA: peptidoglycan-binding domain-containing protein [Gammaproteobacteria bacterium]
MRAIRRGTAAEQHHRLAEVQSRLIDLGYYDGPVDGRPSQPATAALARFQHDHGLPATGRADPATLRALREGYCY